MFEGTQLMARLCSYFLFYGQIKILVCSCILPVKDLFLWKELKIMEYLQWNKASVLIMKIETSFLGMTAVQLTLSRASAVNEEQIWFVQIWVVQLTCQFTDRVPSRVTWTSWRSGSLWTSWGSTEPSARSSTWIRAIPIVNGGCCNCE